MSGISPDPTWLAGQPRLESRSVRAPAVKVLFSERLAHYPKLKTVHWLALLLPGGDARLKGSCTLLGCTLREAPEDSEEVLGQKRLLQESGGPRT